MVKNRKKRRVREVKIQTEKTSQNETSHPTEESEVTVVETAGRRVTEHDEIKQLVIRIGRKTQGLHVIE